MNTVIAVLGGNDVGQPSTVRRPGKPREIVVLGPGDPPRFPTGHIQQPQLVVLVAVGHELAVGTGNREVTEDLAIGGQFLRRIDPVGGQAVELEFAGRIRQSHQRLSVGREASTAVPSARIAGQVNPSTGLRRQDEDVATSGHSDPVAIGREVQGGEVFDGFLDPLFSRLVKVRRQRDPDFPIGLFADVVDPEIGSPLINDAALRECRPQHVETTVLGQLLRFGGDVGIHRPQVHRAIAVGGKVQTSIPDHRISAGPGVIGRQGNCLSGLRPETPERLGRAALVSLGAAALLGEPCEEQRLAVGPPCRLAGLFERYPLDVQGFGMNQHHLGVGQRRVVPGGVGDTPIRCPANNP